MFELHIPTYTTYVDKRIFIDSLQNDLSMTSIILSSPKSSFSAIDEKDRFNK